MRVLTAEHVRVPDHEAVHLRVRDSATLGLVMVRRAAWRARRSVLLLVIAAYVAGLLILTSQQRVRLARWILPAALGFGAVTADVLYPLAQSRVRQP